MSENDRASETGAVSLDLRSDAEMDDLAALHLAQSRTADRLIRIRTRTAPYGITGRLRAVRQHRGGRNAAEFRLGHAGLDIFQNRLESELGNLCRPAQALQFQRALFHEHRTQNRIRIDDIRHTAESVRDIHHDRIREHVPAGNAQLFNSELTENRLPVGMPGAGIVRLRGLAEVHGLDYAPDLCSRGRIGQALRTDDQCGAPFPRNQHAGSFKTRPVIRKITDSRRFRLRGKHQHSVKIRLHDFRLRSCDSFRKLLFRQNSSFHSFLLFHFM